jgi:hypothetical protein
MEAPASLFGTTGLAFFAASVFARTATRTYTGRIVQPTAAIVVSALFSMREATEYTKKW